MKLLGIFALTFPALLIFAGLSYGWAKQAEDNQSKNWKGLALAAIAAFIASGFIHNVAESSAAAAIAECMQNK